METKIIKEHTLRLEKNRMTVTGVQKVVSFSPTELKAALENGGITVKGEGIEVEDINIENQNLLLKGKIISFCYDNATVKEPFLKRLLK